MDQKMTDADSIASLKHYFIGQKLTIVHFVMDYIQLEFDPKRRINLLTVVSVIDEKQSVKQGEPGFENKLVSLITKEVTDLKFVEHEYLAVCFADGSEIRTSLLEKDYPGPEAVNIWAPDNAWMVL